MLSSRIQTGDKEPVIVMILDIIGEPITGLTDIKLKVRRVSDSKFFDWSNNMFKEGASVVTMLQALQEASAAYGPGVYELNTVDHAKGFDTSKIVNPVADDTYHLIVIQDPVGEAANVPLQGEIKVGSFVDYIDQPITETATPSEVRDELRNFGLDHLVSVNPGIVPPAAGTYIRQILDKEDRLLVGGDVCMVKQSYSYDVIAERITGQVWVEKNNAIITNATSVTVTWYNENGTALFAMIDSSPDAQGVFKVVQNSPGLVKNKSYYTVALVSVPDIGTVTSGKGAFTIG